MKRLHLDRWAGQLQPPRNPRLYLLRQQTCPLSHYAPTGRPHNEPQRRQYQVETQWKTSRRHASSRRGAASAASAPTQDLDLAPPPSSSSPSPSSRSTTTTATLRAPLKKRARHSAKLSALHARLALPARLPLETLARCLVDPSADPRGSHHNNAALAQLGADLWGVYTAEHLLCRHPRLPMAVLFAAQNAYVGPATLAALRAEWGVEVAAAPGDEVDAGLLQLRRATPGNALAADGMRRVKDLDSAADLKNGIGSGRPNEGWFHRRGISSRVVYDDQFGELRSDVASSAASAPSASSDDGPASSSASGTEVESSLTQPPLPQSLPSGSESVGVTVEAASAGFVRALAGALYLHAGAEAAKAFHKAHVLSRQLALHALFDFSHPTRDLSRLCAREGFEPPVARLISETGRVSRSPVFVVGVFSGNDKLGEGAGSSLNEARVRAAAAALRSWYLYSPPDTEIMMPSEMESPAADRKKAWKAQMVDVGEVVT